MEHRHVSAIYISGLPNSIPSGGKICVPSPERLLRLWISLQGGKATGERSWPLSVIECQGYERVELHLHSPICLHGVRTHTHTHTYI